MNGVIGAVGNGGAVTVGIIYFAHEPTHHHHQPMYSTNPIVREVIVGVIGLAIAAITHPGSSKVPSLPHYPCPRSVLKKSMIQEKAYFLITCCVKYIGFWKL